MSRILVACVGNVLRTDDGFGPAVAARLQDTGEGGSPALPPEADLVETGIGGMALLQELLDGYDGLVIVDATDRDAAPGTVFVIEPDVSDAAHVQDVHLATPERVLAMAKVMGCLPARVLIVGCQPADADGLGERLTPEVERAVDAAAARVREAVEAWL